MRCDDGIDLHFSLLSFLFFLRVPFGSPGSSSPKNEKMKKWNNSKQAYMYGIMYVRKAHEGVHQKIWIMNSTVEVWNLWDSHHTS